MENFLQQFVVQSSTLGNFTIRKVYKDPSKIQVLFDWPITCRLASGDTHILVPHLKSISHASLTQCLRFRRRPGLFPRLLLLSEQQNALNITENIYYLIDSQQNYYLELYLCKHCSSAVPALKTILKQCCNNNEVLSGLFYIGF